MRCAWRVIGGFACILLACAATQAEVIARWTFNNVNGNVVPDVSGNGNDGTLVNDPSIVPAGKGSDKGVELDARKQQGVELGAQYHLYDQLTLEIWFKPTVRPDYETI